MTNSSPWYRWPIEIDGLPINSMVYLLKAWWIFPWRTVSQNQMVTSLRELPIAMFKLPGTRESRFLWRAMNNSSPGDFTTVWSFSPCVIPHQIWVEYPLVNIQKTMENHHFLMGKLTISMAMFYRCVNVYQRVNSSWWTCDKKILVFMNLTITFQWRLWEAAWTFTCFEPFWINVDIWPAWKLQPFGKSCPCSVLSSINPVTELQWAS